MGQGDHIIRERQFKLVEGDNPILQIKLSGVSEECNRHQLAEDLDVTMETFHGLGLSANQIGIMERAFIMYSNFKNREKLVCFNPEIIQYSPDEVFEDEGCLSYPGLWLKIKRPASIVLKYEDAEGKVIERPFTGLESRIAQHEYDHMEGLNFINRVSKLRLQMATKRRDKQLKKSNRIKGLA